MTRYYLLCAIFALLLIAFPQRESVAQGGSYKVIVNSKNPVVSIKRSELSSIFLKKKTKWANGTLAVPVDLRASSPVRNKFSLEVHGKSTGEIVAFWQKQTFSGRGTAPAQKRSDRSVVAFVQAFPGAVGYVSANAPTGSARVIAVK